MKKAVAHEPRYKGGRFSGTTMESTREAAASGDLDAVNFLVENGFIERRYVCKRCGLFGDDCGCEPSGDFE